MSRQVNEDRVHTNHAEEERPLAMSLDIDDIVEYAEEN